MVDLKCPCGCGGFLVKAFEGTHISIRCANCGTIVTLDMPKEGKEQKEENVKVPTL